jgi:hypothetical protein
MGGLRKVSLVCGIGYDFYGRTDENDEQRLDAGDELTRSVARLMVEMVEMSMISSGHWIFIKRRT